MTWLAAWRRFIPLVLLVLCCGSGCDPQGSNPQDEEKDPHFLTGKSRASTDWEGAVDAYQSALKNNPQSGSAHREIGLLLYNHRTDYAAAIYHFNRFLALRPQDPFADTIRQFIMNSKQELAREVSLVSVNQAAQRDLDRAARLEKENGQLKEQIASLQAQLAYRNQLPAPVSATNRAPQSVPTNPANNTRVTPLPGPPRPTGPADATVRTTPNRTHTVKSGETPGAIARQYGLRVEALMAANPGLDARRMRPGQVLKVPAP